MGLNHDEIIRQGNRETGNVKRPRTRRRIGRIAAAVLSVLLPFAPLAERSARAESAPAPSSQPAQVYNDNGLSAHEDKVDINGQPRKIHLNHDFDAGGTVISNEGASSIFASLRYSRRWLNLELDAGNMWFGDQAAPFGTLSFRPEVNIWRFKLGYYGRISGVGDMPSWLYTSHMGGVGYSQPFGKDGMWRLRVGAAGGGALSVPTYDDIYFNIAAGASLEHKKYGIIYVMPDFYFAADTPMKTAYVGNYAPRLQAVHTGIQGRWWEYTAGVSAMVGPLKGTYMLHIARAMNFSEYVSGDVRLGAGVTHWSSEMGGRNDLVIMAVMNVVMGGRYLNSTNRARFERFQSAGVPQVATEIPASGNLGPYGFGNSGDPVVDAQINQAKARVLGSASFQDFAKSYSGASQSDLIMAARFLGAFLGSVAYDYNAMNALTSARFFDPEVKKIASATDETIFSYFKRYVDWYQNHPNQPLPDDLKSGIAVCAGIHDLVGSFLRANGVPAIVASVNTRGGPHVIAIGKFPDSTMLFDYGSTYKAPPGNFDKILGFYGQQERAPAFQPQLFGAHGYMGTLVTPSGRLLHQTIGVYIPNYLMRNFLGVQ